MRLVELKSPFVPPAGMLEGQTKESRIAETTSAFLAYFGIDQTSSGLIVGPRTVAQGWVSEGQAYSLYPGFNPEINPLIGTVDFRLIGSSWSLSLVSPGEIDSRRVYTREDKDNGLESVHKSYGFDKTGRRKELHTTTTIADLWDIVEKLLALPSSPAMVEKSKTAFSFKRK